jgi:hypothetical protein
LRRGLIAELPDAGGVGEIERQTGHRMPLVRERRRECAAFVVQHVAEHDLRAGLHQRADERRAETPRAARHEDAPAGKRCERVVMHGCGLLLLCGRRLHRVPERDARPAR